MRLVWGEYGACASTTPILSLPYAASRTPASGPTGNALLTDRAPRAPPLRRVREGVLLAGWLIQKLRFLVYAGKGRAGAAAPVVLFIFCLVVAASSQKLLDALFMTLS